MMAKKEFKRLARRSLAMFMTLVMTVSLLQLPAFAADYEDQTMDGWFQLDKENTIKGTTDAEVYEDLGFQLSKTIEQTGENAFEITLKVVTSQTVTTNDAAIQLVIDTSTSMNYCSNCGSSSNTNRDCSAHNKSDRMTEVKKVLTMDGGFLDSLVEANTGAINVSVVTYGLGAKTVTLDNADADQWINIKDAAALAKVKSAIDGLKPTDNATNMQAGLMLARNRLGMDAVQNAAVKYTVLLTDGYANTYTRSDSTSNTTIANGSSPSSANGTDSGKNNAASMATQVKNKSNLYAVGYGTEASYLTDIIGDAKNVFVGSDSASIADAFKDIAESAVEGMNGSGTSVTDPMGGSGSYTMGQYIVLGDVAGLADKGVTSTNGALSWELNPENAKKETVGDTTTYTYEITYPITLDAAAKGFEENKYYPTNGYTYLSVPTDDGIVEIPFNVPGVCGTIPMTEWTIEYYLQGNAEAGDYDEYTLADDDDASVKVWTNVSAPENYKTKYENHTFVAGQTSMQVVPNGENVMRLYYDHIMVPVTVNHFYKTDVIDANGQKVAGEYSAPITVSESVKVGTSYTAEIQTTLGDIVYELEKAEPSSQKITATKDGDNVINLYYTREDDQRAVTSAQVKHIYTTYEYVIEDGEYVLKDMGSVTEIAEQATGIRATTVFNVNPAPKAGYEAFELNEKLGDYEDLIESGESKGFVVVADPAANIRTLHFEKVIDNRQEVQVTVNHNYTKTVTTIVDGKPVTNTYTGKFTETEDAFAGESFTAVEINEHEDDEYVSDSGNKAKLFVKQLPNADIVIDLYYNLVKTPEKTEIIVNHYWVDRVETTVDVTELVEETVVDSEGNETIVYNEVVVGKDIVIEWVIVDSDEDNEVSLYEGESYTAPQIGRTGYTYNKYSKYTSKDTGVAGTDYVLNLYYYADEETDGRDMAEIAVQHNYVTKLTTIVAGAVDVVEIKDGTETEKFTELRSGDEFEAVANTTYGDNDDYTVISEIAPVILQPGTNSTIVINYEREASDLVETTYQVNYEYHTYDMTVVDGVAVYPEEPAVEYGESVNGNGYVGQRIEIASGEREGFAPLTTNPATEQILVNGKNVYTFVYEQYNPLEKGSVTVNHYYKTTTIAIDGTSSVIEEPVLGTPVAKYMGEWMQVEAVLNGFELVDIQIDGMQSRALNPVVEVTVSGDIVVNFYYEKEIDNSVLVDYTITHIYEQYTWDGQMIGEPVVSATEGQGYATTQITASPKANGYELVESTYNDAELNAPYTVTLQEGENDIVFVYEQYLAPKKVDVQIIHNYYDTEADIGVKAPLNVYEEVKTAIPEGKLCTAEKRLADGFCFYSADPEEMAIVVDDEGENVITINYVRDTAEYEVIHIYNRNGNEEGRTTKTLSGLAGDVIKADDIARVTTYNGKTYTFKSISGDITLDADEVQTITLVYNRITGGGGGGGDIVIPEPPQPEPELPEIEIPDEDIPLVDIPDEDIPLVDLPEDDVPMADVPKTGEAMIYRIMAAVSGLTLVALAITGRKKEEELA